MPPFRGLNGRAPIQPISDWHVPLASIFSYMPQSFSRLLTHLIFSTKNRLPLLTPSIQSELHPYLAAILENFDCPSLQVGGVEDHVHILFGLSRTRSIAEVVETVKITSSKWIKTKGDDFAQFHWQSGYGAFSVSQSDAETVINYIRNQYDHHRKTSFQEEYRRFLDRYNIQFDERYVWD
jgi:putative transposase